MKQKYEREMTQLRERVRAPSRDSAAAVEHQPQSIVLEGGASAAAAAAAGDANVIGGGAAFARNVSRSGYLFVRQKPSLLGAARWERAFLFTQAGALLCLAKDQVHSTPLLHCSPIVSFHSPVLSALIRNIIVFENIFYYCSHFKIVSISSFESLNERIAVL